ncbi:MAG: PaaI family thioesterase [Candidatus Promineifilaceae bacterium]
MEDQNLVQVSAYIRKDPYAAYLGATIVSIETGYARVEMLVSAEHTNFHGSTHGGIIFSLADIAFSAACNSHGTTTVGLNVDISFLQATQIGDTLVAEARELSLNGPVGLYELTVKRGDMLIAQCQAMAYRKRDRFINSV